MARGTGSGRIAAGRSARAGRSTPVQHDDEPRRRFARLSRWAGLGHRRLVEPEFPLLRDPAEGTACGTVLLRLRARLRPGRRLERTLLHVHPGARIHDPWNRGLPCERLRSQRVLRGRYRRTAELDDPAYRNQPSRGSITMRRARRTKILATLGPASENPEMVAKLFQAGADVFRLNMSHLPRELLRERVQMIRSVEEKFKRPIAILADLQGPKLRVGTFEGDGA